MNSSGLNNNVLSESKTSQQQQQQPQLQQQPQQQQYSDRVQSFQQNQEAFAEGYGEQKQLPLSSAHALLDNTSVSASSAVSVSSAQPSSMNTFPDLSQLAAIELLPSFQRRLVNRLQSKFRFRPDLEDHQSSLTFVVDFFFSVFF